MVDVKIGIIKGCACLLDGFRETGDIVDFDGGTHQNEIVFRNWQILPWMGVLDRPIQRMISFPGVAGSAIFLFTILIAPLFVTSS